MKETDLSEPVCHWLRGQNLVPYCEVPVQGTCVDIVAIDADRIVAVELKLCLSWQVIRQAMLAQNFADQAWCAGPTTPRSLDVVRQHGIGVLRVRAGQIQVLLRPSDPFLKAQRGRFAGARERLRHLLALMEPGGIAGLPSPINDGPAQQVARLVAPLRRAEKTWAEIFETVPNHYANARSLQGVMLGYGPARAILDTDVE